ncbi:J domain-containing protein [Ralstonia solanacearum]|uniref:J domain-containing protein n=1 Tax=Ralstonia solanacearum TaxID=305 RepID=UPI001144E1AC|nr:J domain-containing protein [Ralstonia solanacearum]MBT1539540.1 J domain-containing protein [Ralstonia solanacearum]
MTAPLQGPWAVLAIAPTQDARQIKRAYAARLKVVRPDEDAAGFQALREAYEWALSQCEAAPARPVVYLEVAPVAPLPSPQAEAESQTEAKQRAEIEQQTEAGKPAGNGEDDAEAKPAPDYSPRRAQAPHIVYRHTPSAAEEVPPSVRGAELWRAFRAALPPQDGDDVSDDSAARIEAQLRETLRHPDLVNFEARDAFEQAALHVCASERAVGALRLACDNAFGWTRAPMPLRPHERQRWLAATGQAAGDRQYQDVQRLARHSAAVRHMLESGPPKISLLRFFVPSYLADVRRFLAQLQSKWPQVLQYRLDGASLRVWSEAAHRGWPTFSGLIGMLALGAFGALLFWSNGKRLDVPEWYRDLDPAVAGSVTAVIALLPVVLRMMYPLWSPAALQRWQARFGDRPYDVLIWYGVRVAMPVLAFFAAVLPPWYADAVTVALVLTALMQAILLLLFERGRILMVFPLAGLFYGALMWEAFKPFYAYGFLVLLLTDTVFFGLRDILHRVYRRDWQHTRARLILLASGAAVVPAQLLLARDLPVLAAVFGWAWFLAGCAVVDMFGSALARSKTFGMSYIWLIGMGLLLVYARLVAHGLAGPDSPVAGILALQAVVAVLAVLALAGTGWQAGTARLRTARQRA